MKKIKLDSGKLRLKKENIGDFLNKETMKRIVGGYGTSTDCTAITCAPNNTCNDECTPTIGC